MKMPNTSGGKTSLNDFLFFSTEYKNLRALRQWSWISCFILVSWDSSSLYYFTILPCLILSSRAILSLENTGQLSINILPIKWELLYLILAFIESFRHRFVITARMRQTRAGSPLCTPRSSLTIGTMSCSLSSTRTILGPLINTLLAGNAG